MFLYLLARQLRRVEGPLRLLRLRLPQARGLLRTQPFFKFLTASFSSDELFLTWIHTYCTNHKFSHVAAHSYRCYVPTSISRRSPGSTTMCATGSSLIQWNGKICDEPCVFTDLLPHRFSWSPESWPLCAWPPATHAASVWNGSHGSDGLHP